MEIVVNRSLNLIKFKDLNVGDFFFNTNDPNEIDNEILAMVTDDTGCSNAVCIDAQMCMTFTDGEVLYFNEDAYVIKAKPVKFIFEF